MSDTNVLWWKYSEHNCACIVYPEISVVIKYCILSVIGGIAVWYGITIRTCTQDKFFIWWLNGILPNCQI